MMAGEPFGEISAVPLTLTAAQEFDKMDGVVAVHVPKDRPANVFGTISGKFEGDIIYLYLETASTYVWLVYHPTGWRLCEHSTKGSTAAEAVEMDLEDDQAIRGGEEP